MVDPPFPVPIASITQVGTSEKNWYYFTGELTAGHVVVRHSGDIHFLHKMVSYTEAIELIICMLGKNFSRRHFGIFFQENRILHYTSYPVF